MTDAKKEELEESTWLAGTEACEAHLVYVATEIQNVTLSAEDIYIQGRFAAPSPDGTIPFLPDAIYGGRLFPLKVRGRVRLDYQGRGVTYCFRARYLKRDGDGRLIIELPRLITRSDRRLVFRYQTHGDPSLALRAEGRWMPPGPRDLRLYDVSTDGVGFQVEGEPFLERGSLLSAELTLPMVGTIVSLLRVTSVRPFLAEPGWHIVGARYMDMGLSDRMAVALALSVWAQQKPQR